MPGEGGLALALLMIGSALLSMAISCLGCAAPHHRRLRRWVPTLEFYFPLATLAMLKALSEIVVRPFHWDKTHARRVRRHRRRRDFLAGGGAGAHRRQDEGPDRHGG